MAICAVGVVFVRTEGFANAADPRITSNTGFAVVGREGVAGFAGRLAFLATVSGVVVVETCYALIIAAAVEEVGAT